MLVLSRFTGERIIICTGPDAVTVEVLEIDGGKVRLGITAPRDVRVDRQELRQRIDGGHAHEARPAK